MDRPFKPTAELTQHLKGSRHSLAGLPREAVPGYPVPVLRNDRVCLAYLFFVLRGHPPQAPDVSPPGWVAFVDATTGDIAFERLDVDLGVSLGVHEFQPKPSYQDFLEKEARLATLLDTVMQLVRDPQWATAETYRQRVSEYRALWLFLAHKPLAAHYRQLNPAWFDTLGIR